MRRALFKQLDDNKEEGTIQQKVVLIYSRCKIKEIKEIKILPQFENASDQYIHYLNNFEQYKLFIPSDCHLHIRLKKFPYFMKQQSSKEDKEQIGQVLTFLGKTKINIYKNILYAFQRHIALCQSDKLIALYESMTKDSWEFSHIQLRVGQNLKQCSRINLKLKNLSSNKNLKKIFIYFLKNSKELWLDNSKILDKSKIEESIQLLIKANELNLLSENISFYKKSAR